MKLIEMVCKKEQWGLEPTKGFSLLRRPFPFRSGALIDYSAGD